MGFRRMSWSDGFFFCTLRNSDDIDPSRCCTWTRLNCLTLKVVTWGAPGNNLPLQRRADWNHNCSEYIVYNCLPSIEASAPRATNLHHSLGLRCCPMHSSIQQLSSRQSLRSGSMQGLGLEMDAQNGPKTLQSDGNPSKATPQNRR